MYARRTPKAVFRRKLNVKTLVDYKRSARTCYMIFGASFSILSI